MIDLIILVLFAWMDFLPHKILAKPDPVVSVHMPVNPVDTGAVFAFHCQASNLETSQSVQIFKTNPGRSQQLTVGESIVVADERVFLASRQMADGSVIYFMSVIDATVEDAAEYSCKIVDNYPTLTEVAVASVTQDVTYFPAISSPVCDSVQETVFREGDVVTLSCNSELGNPTVALKWKRTSDGTYLKAKEEIIDDRVYASVKFTATAKDRGVFICEIVSRAFPGREQSCHIGPLTILSSRTNVHQINTVAPDILAHVPKQTLPSGQAVSNPGSNCKEWCNSFVEDTVSYWVAGTIFAAAIALFFCIVCLVLLMKYCKHTSEDFTDYSVPIEDAEKIYVEVESKRDSGKMYMSLVKPFPETKYPQVTQKM